jgi:hypothetical protein
VDTEDPQGVDGRVCAVRFHQNRSSRLRRYTHITGHFSRQIGTRRFSRTSSTGAERDSRPCLVGLLTDLEPIPNCGIVRCAFKPMLSGRMEHRIGTGCINFRV